jgi:hypothetical protein
VTAAAAAVAMMMKNKMNEKMLFVFDFYHSQPLEKRNDNECNPNVVSLFIGTKLIFPHCHNIKQEYICERERETASV